MAVNRYDNPAQAEFINTYVPIPFEQLYTLGKQAKADVDKALADFASAQDKWSEFRSPSMADMQSWKKETFDKAEPIANKLASNLDMIKTPEGRAQIYSMINNVDRAKLSALKQSREGLLTRQKVNQQLMLSGKYNPLWHDVDFGNYDTLTAGVYNDVAPLAYSSIKDLTDQYVNNLKDSYLGRKDGFIYSGVTGEQIKGILDANKSGILSTPQAQKHMQVYMQQNPGATQEEAAEWIMQKAYTDNQEHVRQNVNVDPYAMQDLKYKQALDAAAMRGKKGSKEEDKNYPDAYKKLYNDAIVQEQRNIYNNPSFANTRSTIATLENAQNGLRNMVVGLEDGTITPEQYQDAVKKYTELETKLQKDGAIGNAIADDIADIFAKTSDIFPRTGVHKDKLPLYYSTSSRVLNSITYPASGQIMNTYNKVSNANEIEINSGDVITKGYSSPDTRGAILATDFVNKLMKIAPIKYMVETTDGLERNFSADLESGVFENVIKTPRGKVAPANFNGTPQLAQRVSIKIPLQSIKNAGYNERSFRKMTEKMMGITSEVGLNIKPIDKENLNDAWGTKSGRGGAALTGEYFTFDVMEPIDPRGLTTRMTFDQEVNDIPGGFTSRNKSYENIINNLLQ